MRISDWSSDVCSSDLIDTGSLTFNPGNTNQTLNYAITGGGSVVKAGVGTLTLNGKSTDTGNTEIASGTLVVGDAGHSSASIQSLTVNVKTGGTLRGHGTIVGNVENSNGIVWPGGSIGTLTIEGNYIQGTDGTLKIDVSPTAASQLNVKGSATLNGTLSLLYGPGTYTSKKYEIVHTGTIGPERFSSVKSNASSVITQVVSYGLNSVYLTPSGGLRSEEHTSELQSLMRTSYAVFCLNKKPTHTYKMKYYTHTYNYNYMLQ